MFYKLFITGETPQQGHFFDSEEVSFIINLQAS